MVPPAASWTLNPGPQSQLPWGQNAGMQQQPWGQNAGMQQQPWGQNAGMQQQPWGQNAGMQQQPWEQNAEPQAQPQQSFLPVPYQGGMALQPYQSAIPIQMVPDIEKLLPAIPDEQGRVYVPPIYTKPRAIIPRYRAISGLLSILIVSLLLCTGAGYYAQASGKLIAVQQFFGAAPPPSLQVATGRPLPDPPGQTDKDKGPAYNIIPSATTTLRIDPNNIALQPVNAFQVGIPFYVTYSVQLPDKAGIVTVKWYMNNLSYATTESKQINPKTTANGSALISYAQPAEGRVELYWNNQLAQQLYFVVR